jgi:two-component system, chemotaxis family, sensor kinase Cph1
VSNYAQLLEKRSGTDLDQRSLRYIFHIVEGTKQMQQQIQDLLRYSRLNTRQKKFELVDTTQVIKRAIATLQLKIKQSQAKISLNSAFPIILGDAVNLQNLWQNLLSNAIKYAGDRPPEIIINCQKSKEQWLFSIQDNGIGIAPEYRERIFQIFQRLHTNEEYPGTGIGLAICQRIVSLHGGKIWVESSPSHGSTFFISLPHLDPVQPNQAKHLSSHSNVL